MTRLKKIIPVILLGVLVVFTFTGCFNPFSLLFKSNISEEDAKAMKGTWVLVAAESDGNKVAAKDIGANMTFVFNENGKCKYVLDGEAEEYKWEKDDDLITIYVPDNSNVSKGHTATLSNDYFTLYWNYNGKPMQMIFARKGTAAEDPSRYVGNSNATQNATPSTPTPAPQPATQPAQQQQQTTSKEPVLLLGDWHLVAKIEGTTRRAVQAVETQNIYYSFFESGEYTLRNFNSDEYGMYRKDGNSLSLKSDNGYSSLLGSLDGDELTVYDPSTNINYVYKKQ